MVRGVRPLMTSRLLFCAAALATVLPATPAVAGSRPTNAAVAARIAAQLGCREFAYHPGASSASGSRGQLDCQLRRQDFTVYVFSSNRQRAQGIAHLKLWSGPDDIYHFALDERAVLVPRGAFPKPALTKKWATVAATRAGGAVFSG